MEDANKYGMIQPNNRRHRRTCRFIIDPKGIVRAILYYPQSTGRYMPEIKRINQSLQKWMKRSIATPANWQPGDDVIVPPTRSMNAAKERMEHTRKECTAWIGSFALRKNSKKEGDIMSEHKFFKCETCGNLVGMIYSSGSICLLRRGYDGIDSKDFGSRGHEKHLRLFRRRGRS
jgi:hypothetical protein